MPEILSFPIVGIGASAGGLAAFEAFFKGMPTDSDPEMAFVLVQHLAPDHKSLLVDLIQRSTRMKVFEATDGVAVEKNCVYVIPPNNDIALKNGKLQLSGPVSPRGQRLPIDFFFRSLAEDQHERAIGIILSGTGSDGTSGIRSIKGAEGIVMAQKLETCEFNGMPHSAIATGLVDYELPPAEMSAQLIAYMAHEYSRPSSQKANKVVGLEDPNNVLKNIFNLIRSQTGHDFSEYKPSTINRRIQRRMAVHHIEDAMNYLKLLQQTPAEVEALYRDILIGVTNFFRDPEAFKALEEQIIPKLFAGKDSKSVVRVWSAGCSTGEEAYSVAILLLERMEILKQSFTVQIFATDIDSRAIATARAGLYPTSIATDITPERLNRFFTLEADGNFYRIHKGIRDMLVFSEQDLIKDPPFSKMDLVICRNVLIYFGAELQEKLVRLFHFALNSEGILFLGNSEGGGDFPEMFNVIDRKAKLYQKKDNYHGVQLRTPVGTFLPPVTATKAAHFPLAAKPTFPKKLPLRELTEQTLLQQIISAGILVNAQGDALYLYGRTGMYLEPATGEVGITNILRMAREGLRTALSTTLHKAVTSNEVTRSMGLRVKTNGHFTMVNLAVCPISNKNPQEATNGEPPLYLVILEVAPETQILPQSSEEASSKFYEHNLALEQELRAKDEHLHNTLQELETTSQDLKSSNEEMQSINEELQSTNEELETSKEELQSVNEELTTVNNELNTKVNDLSRLNNDMNNLLAGGGIATIFVDHKMKILRFTPAVAQVINLIPTDVGRPVTDIVSKFSDYNNIKADVQAVLDTLVPKDLQVQTIQGLWFAMHIMPYRTIANVIEGAVLTFVDISAAKMAEKKLSEVNSLLRLATVVRDSRDAIIMQDLDGKILAWNPSAIKIFGHSEAEALLLNQRDLIPEDLRASALDKIVHLSQQEILEPYQTKRISKDGRVIEVWITASALLDESGKIYAVSTIVREVASKPNT